MLRPRDEEALRAFIAAATTRSSPGFGHYLRRGEFAARFGPAPGAIAAVSRVLGADGLNVHSSAGNGLLLSFSGGASSVARAFATSLHRYRLADGHAGQASTSPPALPSSIAGAVAAVVGLDALGAPHPRRPRHRAALAARLPAASAATFAHPPGSPNACHDAVGAARELGGLTDDEIANAYGAFGLYGDGDTGAGVHIGVFEEEPFLAPDIEHFDTCYFGATAAGAMVGRLHVITLEGGPAPGTGFYGEALLDVEDVSAMAPGASIDVYENPETPSGEVAEIAAMVDEDRDQIITSSYGQPCEQEQEAGQPGTQQALNFLFQQGAAQGQTFLGAAGDNGSDSCEEAHRESSPQPGQNPVSAGEIASQPYVLGVGGTTITDATPPIQEHVWNDGDEGGAGGGGISQSFAMPSWQRDSLVQGIAVPGGSDYTNAAAVEERFGYPTGFCADTLPGAEAGQPCRLEPDVSAQADPYTGAVTIYSSQYKGEGEELAPDGWITTGGTSSATPIWAGLLALADASPTCRADRSTASGVGFVPPLLYAIASDPAAYGASFNDITVGNNDQYGLDGGNVFPARRGFDLVSGLGSPRMSGPGGAAGLAYYLCTYAATGVGPSVRRLSPASGSVAGDETITLDGSGFESAGAPDVASVQVGAWSIPHSSIHVLGRGALAIVMPPARDTVAAGAPAGQDGAGPADVIVTLSDGRSSAPGSGSTFQYLDTGTHGSVPSVTSVLPYGGDEDHPAPVTLIGSGFKHASTVSFGGVNAVAFKILSDSEILAKPPPYSSTTSCTPLPTGDVYAGEGPANDICQVQVLVGDPAGDSAAAPILAPFEGVPAFEQDGALKAPPGCGCEVYPAPTEFDYAPAPAIDSVSTSAGPASLASETGGTLITLHGDGLSRFTLEYANFDDLALEEDQELGSLNDEIAFISGTEIQLRAPALAESVEEDTIDPTAVALSLHTLAGESAPAPIDYAGVPRVTSVEDTAGGVRLRGHSGGADTGGTPIRLTGRGLLGQVTDVRFSDSLSPPSEGTDFTVDAESNSRLETQTVSENPALANVQACTVSGCSPTSTADLLFLYPPGAPEVQSLSPRSGAAGGATNVTIRGQNLGCPLAVDFGARRAESFNPVEALLACGSTTVLHTVSPPGQAGTKVPVTVTTLESAFTGTGSTSALFSYDGP